MEGARQLFSGGAGRGRRRFAATLIALPLLVQLSQCEAKPMTTVVDISLFSYLDRPIFDVLLNGKDIGGTLARGFNGANSSMIGERITLGPQVISWRLDGPKGMPRNGETVRAKNTPVLSEIPKGVTWIAVHVYADDTVEERIAQVVARRIQSMKAMIGDDVETLRAIERLLTTG